jgi:hypothetical protein
MISKNGKLLFNVYISNCLSSSHTNTRSQVYVVLNVEEEAIEVINCKLIWMPAGNKKKQEIICG